LALLFLGYDEVEYHGQEDVASGAAHLIAAKEWREKDKKEPATKYLVKTHPSDQRPPTRPRLLNLYHLSIIIPNYESISGVIH
jgi:hypothetical protein